MTQIIGYMTFNGNCREAMTFYKECFGGDLNVMTVGGTPVADQMPPEAKDNIMHARLISGGIQLMASDCMMGEYVVGNSVSLCILCGSEEETNRFYTSLSEGGNITCPLGVQFWGDTFASLTDKFGINWLLVFEHPKG